MILITPAELLAALDAIAPADAAGQRDPAAMNTVIYFGESNGPHGYGLYARMRNKPNSESIYLGIEIL